jgi:hypothetical protein
MFVSVLLTDMNITHIVSPLLKCVSNTMPRRYLGVCGRKGKVGYNSMLRKILTYTLH